MLEFVNQNMIFTPQGIVLFITFLVNFSIALFVFLKNPKRKVNIIFALIIFLISCWNIINFLSDSIKIYELSLNFGYWTMGSALFIPSLFFYFSLIFPLEKKLKKWQISLIFLPGFILLPFISTEYNIISETYRLEPWGSDFTGGILYPIYAVYFIIYIILGLFILFSKYIKQSSKIVRLQIIYIFFGALLSGTVAIITNNILPYLGGTAMYSVYGTPFSIIFGLCTAYAITRYRFMDIKVVIRKSILYGLLLILAVTISLALIISFYFILKNYVNIEDQIALIISIALLIIVLPSLQKHLQKLLNKYINKEVIDLSSKVEEFTTSISQATQLNKLISKTVNFINSEIKIKQIKFIVRDFRVPELRYVCQYPKDCSMSLAELEDVKDYFTENSMAVKEELPYLQPDDKIDKALIKRLRKFFEKTDSQIIISFKREEKINGYMLLDKKSDNNIYTKEDIDFLNDITPQLNSVLNKVLFYEETVERVRREFGNRNNNTNQLETQ